MDDMYRILADGRQDDQSKDFVEGIFGILQSTITKCLEDIKQFNYGIRVIATYSVMHTLTHYIINTLTKNSPCIECYVYKDRIINMLLRTLGTLQEDGHTSIDRYKEKNPAYSFVATANGFRQHIADSLKEIKKGKI